MHYSQTRLRIAGTKPLRVSPSYNYYKKKNDSGVTVMATDQ